MLSGKTSFVQNVLHTQKNTHSSQPSVKYDFKQFLKHLFIEEEQTSEFRTGLIETGGRRELQTTAAEESLNAAEISAENETAAGHNGDLV